MRRIVTLLYALAALAAFTMAARLQPALLRMRRDYHLSQAEPTENMPPMVAFTTVALGGFRGLIVDALWMRATRLQDEGKYFELVQLAGWITKLQPRFASIWAFHAWNLAYNISVMMTAPEDRWRWVRHGLTLLRDDGLRYNPGSAQLHRELAWIFSHKIGQDMDQAHFYYKRAWAIEMSRAIGGGRPNFDALIATPRNLAELRRIPGVDALLAELEAAGYAPPYDRVLDASAPPDPVAARPADDPCVAALWSYLRAQRVREVYKLDPARMKEVDERYGPLDWRLPQAQAIYWAWMGLPHARTRFDRLSLERAIFQGMADAFLRGRLVLPPEDGPFALTPNITLYPRVHDAYITALNQFSDDATVRVAFRNFLTDAIMIHYCYNLEARAREIFDEMRERFPDEDPTEDFEKFIYRTWTEFARETDQRRATAIIESALYQSHFWRWLNDADQAAGFARLARLVWTHYMEERKDPEFRARTGLPPLEEMDRLARERVRETMEAAQIQRREIRADPKRPFLPAETPP